MRKKYLFQKTKIQPLEMIPTASGRHTVPARTGTKKTKAIPLNVHTAWETQTCQIIKGSHCEMFLLKLVTTLDIKFAIFFTSMSF